MFPSSPPPPYPSSVTEARPRPSWAWVQRRLRHRQCPQSPGIWRPSPGPGPGREPGTGRCTCHHNLGHVASRGGNTASRVTCRVPRLPEVRLAGNVVHVQPALQQRLHPPAPAVRTYYLMVSAEINDRESSLTCPQTECSSPGL